jgi:hypothetical protein
MLSRFPQRAGKAGRGRLPVVVIRPIVLLAKPVNHSGAVTGEVRRAVLRDGLGPFKAGAVQRLLEYRVCV